MNYKEIDKLMINIEIIVLQSLWWLTIQFSLVKNQLVNLRNYSDLVKPYLDSGK